MSEIQSRVPLLGPDSLDLDADRGSVVDRLQFFHADTRNKDPQIFKAGSSNVLSQGFNQVDMAGRNYPLDLADHVFIANHVLDPVLDIGIAFANREIDIDADRLTTLFFMSVNADQARNQKVVDKDMPHRMCGIGNVERIDVLWHSRTLWSTEPAARPGRSRLMAAQ